ncbi:MAG: hypothetical protein EP344_14820 [Bacteroidetes bacterium]|nr:MAG: hypothetical protein EP344_14820 [Bacteroidota bacterium]
MEKIDDQHIEDYLRNKLPQEERQAFEAALAADPDLRQRTDDMRRLKDHIRQSARQDIRMRVEAIRDTIRAEEQAPPSSRQPRSFPWRLIFELLLAAGLLWFGYQYFSQPEEPEVQEQETQPAPATTAENKPPVATPQYEQLFQDTIPGPGIPTQLTVLLKPGIQQPGQPVYALEPDGGGLCLYVHPEDGFWKNPMEITLKNGRYFLTIGKRQYPLRADGEEHDLPVR